MGPPMPFLVACLMDSDLIISTCYMFKFSLMFSGLVLPPSILHLLLLDGTSYLLYPSRALYHAYGSLDVYTAYMRGELEQVCNSVASAVRHAGVDASPRTNVW